MPGPLQAVYFASKAYVTYLSNAVAEELHNTNVTITNLMPGATETEFATTSGMDKTDLFDKTVTARSIAEDGYEGMLKGKLDVVSGLTFSSELFMVSLKDGIEGSLGYGRNNYDFSDGAMVFSKPNQVMSSEDKKVAKDAKGWVLLFHPDLIRRSELGKTIGNYSFFDYEVHEALHLSVAEQQTVTDLVLKIESELNHAIDKHSQRLMVSNIELLLNYCMRYYDR